MRRTSFYRIIIYFLLIIHFTNAVAQETLCGNGIDDDNDGFIDCADSDCYDNDLCIDAFKCSNTLYQVISSTLKKLDPLTGQYESIGTASANYNGAGFNVQDGYIYGINTSSGLPHLWQINNKGKEKDLGAISQFEGRNYVGDFDEEGNLYTYTSGALPSLSMIDVSSETPICITKELNNLSNKNFPGVADITYNPIQKKFFGLSGSHELISLDHKTESCSIVGDYTSSIDVNGGFGAAWSDRDGNSYFSNNKTGKIYRFSFDSQNKVSSVQYVATGQPTNANDGMGCFLSLPPFETNCTDGIDNDGDGLFDCDDPDCASTGFCPAITIQVQGLANAGPSSIVPIYVELINNSNVDAVDFSLTNDIPVGFSYIYDTIEYSSQAPMTVPLSPEENIRAQLKWKGLSIAVGDTIAIAYSLLVDKNIVDSTYDLSYKLNDVIQSPYIVDHSITIDKNIFYNAQNYSCEPAFYQVYKKRGQPNVLGKLNPTTATYEKIALIDHQANGLGFDITSGYAYGSDGKKFIRIDGQGNVAYMGLDFDSKVYVGDVDDQGNWYGKVGGNIVKVDIGQNIITASYLNQGMPGWDMAYNQDGHFYAVHGKDLYQFNTSTNTKVSLGKLTGETVPNSGHGAQWTGLDGYHYISNNKTGKIFRINVSDRKAIQCMVSEENLQFNDGFACPTQLPVVFQYDYGDNQKFPIARQLVYQQDISNDDVPDYSMVWSGSKISHETSDPSDLYAKGDTHDDGFSMSDTYEPGEINNSYLILNTNSSNMKASWGVWIDWNNDGAYDEFYNGERTISGLTTIEIPVRIPSDFIKQTIAIRTRISSQSMVASNFSGDINEAGEIEDYIISTNKIEICGNGDDDDQDGLIDCDDPDCSEKCNYTKTGSAGNGGLESSDNLIDKITEALYQRNVSGSEKGLNKSNLQNIKSSNRSQKTRKTKTNSEFGLEDLIPIDVIPNSETFISSPEYLTNVTNATDLFSVDIYQNNDRVAAILTLESSGGVYEHTKYICDRLTGSKILDILEYKVDGMHKFIITKLELPNGDIEYTLNFSIRTNDTGNMTLESHWNLGDYPFSNSYLNFQIWANNTQNIVSLTTDIFRRINTYSEINEYQIGARPKVYVQSGNIHNGELKLKLINKSGVTDLKAIGTFGLTETTDPESYSIDIPLSGEEYEELKLNIGDVYYMGLAFHNDEDPVEDAIFLANGAWGYSYDQKTETISNYKISSTSHNNPHRYNIQRSVQTRGQVLNYISLYRSFAPRFTIKDLDIYNSISFLAKGKAKLEISIIKEGIDKWEEQCKTVINLTDKEQEYVLGKDFFKDVNGVSKSWEDATLIAINILGDGQQLDDFDFELSDIHFGHQAAEHPVVIYASNIIGPKQNDHTAMQIDGSTLENIELAAGDDGSTLNVTIENLSTEDIIIDDIWISSTDNSLSVENFEPSEIRGKAKSSFDLRYTPTSTPDTSQSLITVSWYNEDTYEEISFQVTASATCVMKDDIISTDLDQTSELKEYKAVDSITSNAKINKDQNVVFSAGEKIDLTAGFEVGNGGEFILIAQDRCSNK